MEDAQTITIKLAPDEVLKLAAMCLALSIIGSLCALYLAKHQ